MLELLVVSRDVARCCGNDCCRLMKPGKSDREVGTAYAKSSRKAIALEAACLAWSQGVPGADDMEICSKSVKKASAKLVRS